MKKYCIMALALVLAACFCACSMGGSDTNNTTGTTRPSTVPTTLMPTVPPIATNIPDPEVDTGSVGDMDGTQDDTGMTDSGETGNNGSERGLMK